MDIQDEIQRSSDKVDHIFPELSALSRAVIADRDTSSVATSSFGNRCRDRGDLYAGLMQLDPTVDRWEQVYTAVYLLRLILTTNRVLWPEWVDSLAGTSSADAANE